MTDQEEDKRQLTPEQKEMVELCRVKLNKLTGYEYGKYSEPECKKLILDDKVTIKKNFLRSTIFTRDDKKFETKDVEKKIKEQQLAYDNKSSADAHREYMGRQNAIRSDNDAKQNALKSQQEYEQAKIDALGSYGKDAASGEYQKCDSLNEQGCYPKNRFGKLENGIMRPCNYFPEQTVSGHKTTYDGTGKTRHGYEVKARLENGCTILSNGRTLQYTGGRKKSRRKKRKVRKTKKYNIKK